MDLEQAFLLVITLSALEVAVGTAGARESCSPLPQVDAVLADGHSILPWGMDPVGVALAAEFRRMDVELVWSTVVDPDPQRIVIYVNLLPHPPTDWGLSKSALGGVRRDEAGSSPVFIFYPAVEQVLGVPGDTSRITDPPISPAKWTLGLARIIAHEILHVLLPEKSHDRSGIFAPDLKRSTLLSQELKLENETRAALAERLCVRSARVS